MQAGPEVASRFLAAVPETLSTLLTMPRMAPLVDSSDPRVSQIRRWPVRGFDHWLIYYRVTRTSLRVVRILHSARNRDELLRD